MSIIRARKIYYAISGLLVLASFASLAIRGLNLGVDFKGDARLELAFKNSNPSDEEIRNLVGSDVRIEKREGDAITIRTKYLTEEEHSKVLEALRQGREVEEKSFVSTGPSIGRQLRRNAVIAILLSLAAIVAYIAFTFRQVSRPVSSWLYGFIAIIALVHDVSIPTGLFSLLGYEIDALFVTALLTVLGFSVHDTIVVFDRVRENLHRDTKSKFEDIVEKSLRQTIGRSINTSLTTIFALTAIYLFGGVSTQNLALALIVGIIVGTYSSIFIATPLLVSWESWRRQRK